jgi:hypothetical protein
MASEIEQLAILLMSTHSTQEADPQSCDDRNMWFVWVSSAACMA